MNKSDTTMKSEERRTAWFAQARFGMFIHWGAFSVPGRNEWVMWQERIPPDEYARFADRFRPTKYDPDAWAALAKEAGMKYMVLTTRHCDGYCLFDTATTKFNAVQTGPGRDLVAPYVKACRKAGLKVGLYYSLADWRCPDFWKRWTLNPTPSHHWDAMVRDAHAQVRELCTNYGPIDLLWYDALFAPKNSRKGTGPKSVVSFYDSKRLNAMVRRLQPQIVLNDRSGYPEDFDTPEGHITASPPGRMWEACDRHNKHWGYCADDTIWKSSREIVQDIVLCARGAGNYLLNVGPKPDGTIPEPSVRMLKDVGGWLRRNGEAIYGTVRFVDKVHGSYGGTTSKPGRIYLQVYWWPGTELKVPTDGDIKLRRAWIVSNKQSVKFTMRGKDIYLTNLPAKSPDPLSTVIALEVQATYPEKVS